MEIQNDRKKVSIPHRFNSHQYYRKQRGGTNEAFQSLTGSIHTPNCQCFVYHRYIRFQSLTGSIHTKKQCSIKKEGLKVSIPHRFNSHFDYPHDIVREYYGFNPSQVQFTQFSAFKVPVALAKFQSLTGSIHTFTINIITSTQFVSFNPSQVQFTQLYYLKCSI